MRWLAMILLTPMLLTAEARAEAVGFQTASLPDPLGRPLAVGIWYPTTAAATPRGLADFTQDVAPDGPVDGTGRPLVVMSHGSGGSFVGHYDTALALAKAGNVVAAVTHEGDSHDDVSRRAEIWIRPAQLKQLVDYMLTAWPDRGHIDARRVGAFGFSAGGFTVLVAAGGTPDLRRIASYCRTHADTELCRDVAAAPQVAARISHPLPAATWVHDPRVVAAVVAAPAIGFTFGERGLAHVRIPIQLWRAEADRVQPAPDYAEAVRAALPAAPEYHVAANADHYDFLAPCPPALAAAVPEICRSRPGFDRLAFHQDFNRRIVEFFRFTLR